MSSAAENGISGDANGEEQISRVTYEQLVALEEEHEEVNVQMIRTHWKLNAPLFKKRQDLIRSIPNFWTVVLDEAPPEVDHHVQPSDARFLAEHLRDFSVDRFELEREPRSFSLRFDFTDNDTIAEKSLEKRFWWRTSIDGWSGLVSEPVNITWTAGKDLTDGLTDATCKLWRKWQAEGGEAKRAGFAPVADSAEYKELQKRLETSDFSMHSFFTLFTFVSAYRFVGADEDEEALSKEAERRAARKVGKELDDGDDDDEDDKPDIDDGDVMACPGGDDLATVLAEEIYANGVKYFMAAHERDEESLSEVDFESGSEVDDDDDDEPPQLVSGTKRKAEADGEATPQRRSKK